MPISYDWQFLIDAGVDESTIEQRLTAGISLEEQRREYEAELECEDY